MTQWTPEDPGEGDTEPLSRLARKLDNLSQACTMRTSSISGALDARRGCWTGEAAEAWSAALAPTAAQTNSTSIALTAAATALRHYANEVDEIARLVDLNRKTTNTVLGWAEDDDISCTVRGTYGGSSCTANTDSMIPDLDPGFAKKRDLASSYTVSLRNLDSDLEDLVDRRRAADKKLKDALAEATGAVWSTKEKLFTAVGVTDPAQMTDDRIGSAMAEYADDAVHGFQGGLSDEELEHFAEFFTAYGQNESVLSVVYTKLGGDTTRLVAQRLEERASSGNVSADFLTDTLLPVSTQFRDGLALGSQHWSKARSATFANSLFGVESESTPNGPVSAFLFDGSKPMGPNLAAAFANALDTSERVYGRQPPEGSAPFDDIDKHSYLLSYDRNQRGEDLTFSSDVASGVMTQLSKHPDEAVAFFAVSDGKRDDQKMKYWFSDRTWTDGLTAATSLVECFQHAKGSMMSPSERRDSDVLHLTASQVGQGLTFLDQKYGDSPLSDPARINVAKVLTLNLLDLQSTTFQTGDKPNRDFVLQKMGQNGEAVSVRLHLSSKVFTAWVGRAQLSLGGITLIQQAANLIEANAATMTGDKEAREAAITEAARMRGYIDAGRPQADMRASELSDEEYTKARNAAFTVIGLIPWTAPLRLAGLAGYAVGTGISLGMGAVSDLFSPHGLADAKSRAQENLPIIIADEKYRLVITAVKSGIAPSSPPPEFDEGGPTAITDAQRAWAEREWDGVAEAYDREHPALLSLGAHLATWADAAGIQIEAAHGGGK